MRTHVNMGQASKNNNVWKLGVCVCEREILSVYDTGF